MPALFVFESDRVCSVASSVIDVLVHRALLSGAERELVLIGPPSDPRPAPEMVVTFFSRRVARTHLVPER